MSEDAALPQDHFVSRGYQQNFASSDKRVAIFDVRAGLATAVGRPIRSNFRERGFTTFVRAGVPNGVLERAFAGVESRVLNEIRAVSPSRRGPQQKAAVANLFAIHLVRSPAYKRFHSKVSDRFANESLPQFARESRLLERFEASEGRPPADGELEDLTQRAYDEMVADPLSVATAMARHHDLAAELFNRLHLQVVSLAEPYLPGFVIGDTPVVHASLREGRYGFREELALGDADFIIGPLTRTTAACFTVRPLDPVLVKTRRTVDAINAIFVRAAQQEVACHPDDARVVGQLFQRLHRLPPSILTGT